MDASKTLVDTNLYLLLVVYKHVNILLLVLKLFTLSSILPFVLPPCFTLHCISCSLCTRFCKHQGMRGEHVVCCKKTTTVHLHMIMEDELPFVPSVSLLAAIWTHVNCLEKTEAYMFCVASAMLQTMYCELLCPDSRSKMCLFLVLMLFLFFSGPLNKSWKKA